MVSATPSAQANPASILLSAPASTASVNSFAQQLATTLEQYLSQSRNGSQLELDIQPASGPSTEQDSSSSQFLITVRTPLSVDPNSSAASQTPSSLSQAASTPADEYVQVPFGNSMINSAYACNRTGAPARRDGGMPPAAILQQDKVSAAGDPMAGQTIQGTNHNWDDLTQDQQLAYIYAMNYGVPGSQTMQAYLDANVGQHIMANAPCKHPMMFGNA
jgi:hypothetical protein